MRRINPAEVRPEPATQKGVTFLEAAGCHRCLWPLSGAGADMVVCGAKGYPYCKPHQRKAMPGGPAPAV